MLIRRNFCVNKDQGVSISETSISIDEQGKNLKHPNTARAGEFMNIMFIQVMPVILWLLLSGNAPVMARISLFDPVQDTQGNGGHENATVCDETSRSTITYTEVQHRWIIEHFHTQNLMQQRRNGRMESAEFRSPGEKHRFRIAIQSDMYGYQHGFIIYLIVHTNNDSLSCKVKFAIERRKNETLNYLREQTEIVEIRRGGMEIAKQALPYNLDQHINNDELVILCTVTIYERSSIICDSGTQRDKDNAEAFVDSFKRILDDRTSSDMEIIANSCVINAHKSILLARSPKMVSLIRNTTEGNSFNATQYSCDAMRCVVEYIYTDKCSLKSQTAPEVLLAANEYQLIPLKRIAEKVLIESLSDENIASYIKLVKNTPDNALIRSISRYIMKNRHILNTAIWTELEMEDARQAAFVLRKAILLL
uniref:BTB domain-containing protein n=1 Tax=Trichuris muris TaxID=70415 RepID=A0A5S6QP43_TRIMR